MAEVIASILADRPSEVVRRARMAAMNGADWIEIRLDTLGVEQDPAEILEKIRLPVLVACRTTRDGGRFTGAPAQRRALLQRWVTAGVQGIDLEGWEDWTPDDLDRLDMVVRSHHNLTGIDGDLEAIRDRLLAQGAHFAKLAVTAHDLAGAAPVLELLARTDQVADPTVAFAMGDVAWPTRVLAAAYGAPFTYAAADSGSSTAPGQPPVERLTGLFDVHRATRSTLLFGVLGNPAQHSWGPWLFNRAFRRLEFDGIYLPFTTSHPLATVAMLSPRRLRGVSVTAPHKTAVMRLCHEIDDDAAACGALNTLVFRAHGVVAGHNTDVVGVKRALEEAGVDAAGKPGLVLGGGGAARAAALALEQLGLHVTLMPRSLDTIRELATARGYQLARADSAIARRLQPAVVVNATPLGGPSAPAQRPLPDWELAPGMTVLDMAYQPRSTPLLDAARAAGAIPVHGLRMFLAQAAEQIYHFTGRRLPVDVLAGMVGR
ncbi:MAG: type I 3-dehydroquinate dehydratase [Planctomycetes bacterium]|nr:type I 3-dehydroquinate dehydratase [Planctomycetota bacterium]